jgi:hypothetical protein
VLTDLIQFALLAVASVCIAIVAVNKVSPEMLAKFVPDGWNELFFGWKINLDWSGRIEQLNDPEKDEVLESFYRTIRPWGFWKPVYRNLLDLKANTDFRRDAFNVAIGIVWQLTLNIIPICLIIGQYRTMWISIVILAVTSVIMKFTWYDKLGPGDMYMPEDG